MREGWQRARAAAWAPDRRVKAMFKGDVSPTVGAAAHGYLLFWWDGVTLSWKASAPLAGDVRGGRLSAAGERGPNPLPMKLGPEDAIGVLLGVLDLPAAGRPVERVRDRYRLFLDGYGRVAVLDTRLSVVGLELPNGTRVSFGPGEGLPRRIEAASPDGRARLALESLAPWPAEEPVPGG